MAGEPVIAPRHLKWAKFCHACQALLCLMWFSACLLMYFHAPSFQAEQLYDCRWHLSCLLISAGFGYLFIYSPSALTFGVTFVAAQYSIVYSFLSLVIYGVDCLMIINGPPTALTSNPSMTFASYLKLATVIIVLSTFGLGISMIYVHRLYLIGWEMSPPKRINNLKTIQIFSGLHACFAIFTMYVVEELIPFKTWFIRVYMIHEFSCSLLSLSLAVLQITALVNSNTVMLKAIFIANLCQFVQELQIGSSAFFTTFYIQKLSNAAHMSDVTFRVIIVILNLVAHLCRMIMCGVTVFMIAPVVWNEFINLRVIRRVDSERLTANQDYALAVAKENRWLLHVCAWATVIAVGHFALNSAYVIMESIIEALMIAAGTTFMFSLLVLASMVLYLKRRYRLALLAAAYFSLNLFVSSGLMIASFIQDVIFGITSPTSKYAFLYLSDVLLSVITIFVAEKVLKFCMRNLMETYTLAKQPVHVVKAVRMLRMLALFCILVVGIEFGLLLELRIDAKAAHLNMTSSIHDWLISAVQSIFLYWVTIHERYQCVLLVLIFQLANVSLVSLDLLAQQTDLMQMLITLLFQHGKLTQNLKSAIPNFPINHFIVIVILHFIQFVQWFMTLFGLGLAIYIIDNIVEDDSVKSNDNHEISILGRGIGSDDVRIENNHSDDIPSSSLKNKIENEKKKKEKNSSKTLSSTSTNGVISFENSLFNDPLAMSKLPDPDRKNTVVEETEMEDIVIDENPKK